MDVLTTDYLNLVLEAVGKIGVPALALFFIAKYVAKAVQGVHEGVLMPLVEAHTEFLSVATDTQKQQANTLRDMAKSADNHGVIMREIVETQKALVAGQTLIHQDILAGRRKEQ